MHLLFLPDRQRRRPPLHRRRHRLVLQQQDLESTVPRSPSLGSRPSRLATPINSLNRIRLMMAPRREGSTGRRRGTGWARRSSRGSRRRCSCDRSWLKRSRSNLVRLPLSRRAATRLPVLIDGVLLSRRWSALPPRDLVPPHPQHDPGTGTVGTRAPRTRNDPEGDPDARVGSRRRRTVSLLLASFAPSDSPHDSTWSISDREPKRTKPSDSARRLVSVARGEQQYFDPSGLPTAAEACKSNALMRCCKDLGIAGELW